METKAIEGLTLFFNLEEREAADMISEACETSIALIHDTWSLATPHDVRVYVMTSWPHFIFHSAPWTWRIVLAITLPLWVTRVRRTWQLAGGWTQRYGKRRAIGVKPPRLLQNADRSVGLRIFVPDDDTAKVRHITCHELVHGFTAHLNLPVWLNEGLAMSTVDKFAGKPTVQHTTLQTLAQTSTKTNPRNYRGVRIDDHDALVYITARGYWITRFLSEVHPNLLQDLLSERLTHTAIEDKVAAAWDMDRETFWYEIDGMVVRHFSTSYCYQ